MAAEKQVEAVAKKLMELNPGFDGKVTNFDGSSTPGIENGVVTEFGFDVEKVMDISPVRALARLRFLRSMKKTGLDDKRKGELVDLTPLAGMSLHGLNCSGTKVFDLSPLHGMPLADLNCGATLVSDLSAVRGMPLNRLQCGWSAIADLSPLQGMALVKLSCYHTQVSNLAPLESCKSLKLVECWGTKIAPAAVAALQKSLPNCKIVRDAPAEPKTPEPAASGKK